MAKTITKKVGKPLSPKPAVEPADTAYLVREDLDDQQEQLMDEPVVAAGANALKTPAPAAAAEQPPAPTTARSKPLAPLAALWPSPIPPQAETSPSKGPAPQKASVAAVAAKTTPATAAPKTLSVRFAFHRPDAKAVSLAGDFNGWSPSATPMKRHDNGHWETTVALAPGRYQYKFIVDGEWIIDPAAQKHVPNEQGSLNSVVEVRA